MNINTGGITITIITYGITTGHMPNYYHGQYGLPQL
jgi:hypothetical protein